MDQNDSRLQATPSQGASRNPELRRVSAGRGVAWWSEGWQLFLRDPTTHILMGLLFAVVMVVLQFIPIIGAIASSVLTPVLIGGWLMAVRKLEQGGRIQVMDLFSGFSDRHRDSLLILGGLSFAAMLVFMIAMAIIGMVLGAGAPLLVDGTHSAAGRDGLLATYAGIGFTMVLGGLVFFALYSMAIYFAPALVVFDDVRPIDAVKRSFQGCLANLGAIALSGIVGIVFAIIAAIPFGLGFIVLCPVMMMVLYAGYRDVFGAAATSGSGKQPADAAPGPVAPAQATPVPPTMPGQ